MDNEIKRCNVKHDSLGPIGSNAFNYLESVSNGIFNTSTTPLQILLDAIDTSLYFIQNRNDDTYNVGKSFTDKNTD